MTLSEEDSNDIFSRLRLAREREGNNTRHLELLLANFSDPVFLLESDNACLMNQAARRLLALPDDISLEEAWQAGPLFEVYDELGRLLLDVHWPQAHIFRGKVLQGSTAQLVMMHTRDGLYHRLEVTGSPVYEEAGRIYTILLICREIGVREGDSH